MALSILDGNQSATTLSTIVTSGQHIPAHTVVSLGTQAITDMRGAVSGSVVSVSSLPAISGTVTANLDSTSFINAVIANNTNGDLLAVEIGGVSSLLTFPISGTVTIGSALPAGTNRIGVVTIGGGTVTIGAGTAQIGSVTASLAYSQTATTISSTAVTAIPVVFPTSGAYGGSLQGYNGANTYIYSGIQAIGNTSLASATSLPVSLGTLPALVSGTAQIGSVTASISGTVPVSGAFWQTTQPVSLSSTTVTVSSLPALAAGTAQIGSVTASISNSVVTFFPAQGTTVANSNFTSITPSTTLVSAVAGREVLTVFNEGAGNLHISPGATCTTVAYQVRLSAGDYWECPAGQLTLAHTAVFATAGTARVTEVS